MAIYQRGDKKMVCFPISQERERQSNLFRHRQGGKTMNLEKARKEYAALEEKKKTFLKPLTGMGNFYGVGGEKGEAIIERQKAIYEELKEAYRLTEVNRRVIIWRKKIMAHREIKTTLERYHIPIEDVALSLFWNLKWDFKIEDHYENPQFLAVHDHSSWDVIKRYFYGGPKAPIEVIFKHVPGTGYQIIGVFLKKEAFPKKGVHRLFEKGSERMART
jgi:hypothetical protein